MPEEYPAQWERPGQPPVRSGGGIADASGRGSICERNRHRGLLTTLILFGMPLAFLRSQLISISVPQPRAYHKAQASAARLSNGYRRSAQY